MGNPKLVVAVAGASGYIGQSLLQKLQHNVDLIGLAREVGQRKDTDTITWRSCDLFSLSDAEKGLEGADIAVYLVHSLMPSAKLTQGKWEDMEAILADNFAQAAKRKNIKEVIYLGGIIPEQETNLSRYLESQLEVERILRSYGTPVTALRAGLIVGPKESSFSILAKVVKRLPFMLLPKWRRTKTQPIALADVMNALSTVILDKVEENRSTDIGGPGNLVKNRKLPSQKQDVRSVQRVKLPQGATADWIGRHYMRWLEHLLTPLISTPTDEELSCKINLFGKVTLLSLRYSKERSTPNRALYYITDGILMNGNKNERGRMEFRKVPGVNEVIIGIHDFTPALPWFIYHYTQANAHLFVMYLFRKHMDKMSQHDRTTDTIYN